MPGGIMDFMLILQIVVLLGAIFPVSVSAASVLATPAVSACSSSVFFSA